MQGCKESGRSMIEMLGVLAIIGVLSAGGIAGYSSAMESHKVNRFMEMAAFVDGAFRMTFPKLSDTDEKFYLPSLCSLNIVPSDICNASASGNNRKGYFGEMMTVVGAVKKQGDSWSTTSYDGSGTLRVYRPYNYVYFYFYSALPVTTCAKLLSNQGWNKIGEFVSSDNISPRMELPIAFDKAIQVCQAKISAYSSGIFFSIVIFPAISGIE